MDFFKLLSTLGPRVGGARSAGPLASIASSGGAGPLGPVGGPRELPRPIPSIDPNGPHAADMAALAPPAPELAPPAPPPMIEAPAPAGPEAPKRRGALDRVGDFVTSDTGKGALFRAAASMLDGGSLGDGMMAGAGYVDGQKELEDANARYEREFGLRERGVNIQQQGADADAMWKAGQLELGGQDRQIDIATLQETIRKNTAGEVLTEAEQQMMQQWRAVQANLRVMEEGGRNDRNVASLQQSDVNSQRSADASRYSTDASIYRAGITDGDEGYSQVATVVENEDGSKTTTTNRTPNNPVRVTTQAQYAALPPGTRYVDANGTPGVK